MRRTKPDIFAIVCCNRKGDDVEQPPSSPKPRLSQRITSALSRFHWTSVGLVAALAVVALFFVLSGIGQPNVWAFSSVALDDPILATSNERGTVIVDSARSRLIFVDSNNELRKIVEVDKGEVPIIEVSRVELTKDNVVVSGAVRTDDGETIATESILVFDYEGTYIGSAWDISYVEGVDLKNKDTSKDKQKDKKDKDQTEALSGKALKEGHFEPTVLDLTAALTASSDPNGLFFVRSSGFATSGSDVNIHHLSIKDESFVEDGLLGIPSMNVDEFVQDASYLPDSQQCVILGDWGSLLVTKTHPAEDKPNNAAKDEANNEYYSLHTASVQERYSVLDASGDTVLAYDCVGRRLVRFDGVSTGKPQKNVVDSNVDVDTLTLNGTSATVVLNNNEIRKYDITSGKYQTVTEIYPEISVKSYSIVQTVSWAYLIILGIVLIVGAIRRALREGNHQNLRRGIISFAVAAIFMGFLLYSFSTQLSNDISDSVTQLSHASAIIGYTSPQTVGDATKREVQALEAIYNGNPDVENKSALKDHYTVKTFLEEFGTSSYKNGVGIQSALYGVSSDGSRAWLLSNSQRLSVSGLEVTDETVLNNVKDAIKDTASYASYNNVDDLAFAIAQKNPVHPSYRNSSDGYLFTCYVPLTASDGNCRAVLEVSQHFESFWNGQLKQLLNTLLTFALIAIGLYYASDEVLKSGHAIVRFRELNRQGVEWAGALLTRPAIFLSTLATGIDAALAVVLARDMLSAQGVDSNALLWSVPALAITAGDLIGTLLNGRYAGRIKGRKLTLSMLTLGIVAQCACIFAVTQNAFLIFIVGKLFSGIGYSVVTSMLYGFAYHAEGEDRLTAIRGGAARTPAYIFAGVLGGLLSSVGSVWLYVAAAAVGVVLFLMLRYALPKDRFFVEEDQGTSDQKLFKFVFSKKMVATALLVMIPITLAGGYRKFIFPLLLDSSGMTKQQIANIFVIADVALYVADAKMRDFKRAHNPLKMTWVSLLALGVTFMLFSLNQSPWLAILVVLVASVLTFFAKSYKKIARSWGIKEYGYDYNKSSTILRVEDTAIKNVRAPILGALQTLGGAPGCVILGGVIGICGTLYALISRKFPPDPSEKKA